MPAFSREHCAASAEAGTLLPEQSAMRPEHGAPTPAVSAVCRPGTMRFRSRCQPCRCLSRTIPAPLVCECPIQPGLKDGVGMNHAGRGMGVCAAGSCESIATLPWVRTGRAQTPYRLPHLGIIPESSPPHLHEFLSPSFPKPATSPACSAIYGSGMTPSHGDWQPNPTLPCKPSLTQARKSGNWPASAIPAEY